MMAFPGMLVSAAERAGIKVPDDPDNYDKTKYPHFAVFCTAQLGNPMPYAGVHWKNARVIAEISDEDITKVTFQDLENRGFRVGYR